MIISKKYKFIFIHIPKTGGCSVENALINHLGKEDLITDRMNYQHEKINAKFCDIPHHSTLRSIHELTSNEYKDYYKFAFVRNPYERMVSMYSFYSQLKNEKKEIFIQTEFSKFNAWLLGEENIINSKLSLKAQNQWKNKPKIEFIVDDNNEIGVDFIGRMETFHSDLLTVGKKLGIDIEKTPDKNKSRHLHYSVYYSIEGKKKVEKEYMNDFKKFLYTWSNN